MKTQRPNVLFIMADQWNASCLGNEREQVRTPALDALASEGVMFSRAFCNNPICSPSRITFMTGQYPHTHGILGNNNFDIPGGNPNTLGATFRRHGYQTALVGKSHMIGSWDREAFEHIRYCDLIDGNKTDPLENHYFRYLVEQGIADQYDLGTLPADHPGSDQRAFESQIPEEHSVETWTGDQATEFLRRRDQRRPFFMHLSFQRPHEPLTVPEDTGLLYDPDGIEIPASAVDYFENHFAGKPKLLVEYGKGRHGYPYIPDDESDLKRQLAHYYSLITRIDAQIGRLIELLKESGDYDDTVIVFTADHGDFAGEHGMILKNIGIYESLQRIPFILKMPQGPQGKKVDGIIESVDLFPTLCSLSDIPVPDSVEGIDIAGIAAGGPGKAYAACEWDFPRYQNRVNAIRTDRYRLVYYGHGEDGELYDHDKDPGELKNLYELDEYTGVRQDLIERLFDHVNGYRALSSMFGDAEISERTKNGMTRLLQVGRRNWNELRDLYIHQKGNNNV